MGKYLDMYLEQRMNSSEGEEIKGALESTIAEEKNALVSLNCKLESVEKNFLKLMIEYPPLGQRIL